MSHAVVLVGVVLVGCMPKNSTRFFAPLRRGKKAFSRSASTSKSFALRAARGACLSASERHSVREHQRCVGFALETVKRFRHV